MITDIAEDSEKYNKFYEQFSKNLKVPLVPVPVPVPSSYSHTFIPYPLLSLHLHTTHYTDAYPHSLIQLLV
jgi:hypothetical protein